MDNKLNTSRFKVGDKVLVTRSYLKDNPNYYTKGSILTIKDMYKLETLTFNEVFGGYSIGNPDVKDSDFINLKDLSKLGRILYGH